MIRTLSRRTVPALVVPLIGFAGLLAASSAEPAHAETKAPQLSITVDDGRTDAKAGDELRYTVTVTNLGGKRVEDLRVTQTVPAGAKLGSADHEGRAGKDTVAWTVDVGPGRSKTLKTSLTLARELPPDLLRLATVGCASTSAKAPPVVCASDSDELPAGAAATAQRADLEQRATSGRPRWVEPAALGVAALVLATVLSVVLMRQPGRPAGRKTRRRR